MSGFEPPRPPARRLRVYAFDPSISRRLDAADINEVVLDVSWESGDPGATSGREALQPGPVGEYLEIVDYDAPSGAWYAPVDLDHPHILAQQGLPPSEGVPQFHQQMVYAVAMTTIKNFEEALGRVALWSARWVPGRRRREEFVRRLRVYPHALREANAYYSPQKKALLFGYFPAVSRIEGTALPGGITFTCLSHDIIAHETTHALLDGMHRRYIEDSNPDVLAFHEAFADLVALLQHFSHSQVVVHQISRTRGDLRNTESLLGQLAQEFGQATGGYGSLREAIGQRAEDGSWEPAQPDPTALTRTYEPHDRGAILVAAVFDAFLAIYSRRTSSLLRIATSGSGILPEGRISGELARALAKEASKAAGHVLRMCIRALDYSPPVDITFGDYLRALVTADYDLVEDDDLGYRIALIEAFRRWGIYPRDVRSLSEESVRWEKPDDAKKALLDALFEGADFLADAGQTWDRDASREAIWEQSRDYARQLNDHLKDRANKEGFEALGLEFKDEPGKEPKFEVHSVRPARRIGPDGQFLMELVIELTQQRPEEADNGVEFPFRGGCTLLFNPVEFSVRYVIYKRMNSKGRLHRQRRYRGTDPAPSLRTTYFRREMHNTKEPFALLHRSAPESRRARDRTAESMRPAKPDAEEATD